MATSASPPPLTTRRKLLFAALLVAAPMLLVEGSLRVYYRSFASPPSRSSFAVFAEGDVAMSRYVPHPYLTYALQPSYRSGDGKTTHGPAGFRGPRHADQTRVEGRKLIATVGGSTTYTIKVDADHATYPAQLEAALREETGDESIQVLNAGVPGYTTFESLINLAFRVLDLEPDFLVVYHAVNDLHARRSRHFVPDNTGYRRPWRLEVNAAFGLLEHCFLCRWVAHETTSLKALGVENYTRNNSELVDEPPVELLAQHLPTVFRRNLENIVRLAKSRNTNTVLCTFASNPSFTSHYASWPFYRAGLEEMNRVIREVSDAEGTLLVDVASELPQDPALWVDGVHLNASGARRKGEIVARALVAQPTW